MKNTAKKTLAMLLALVLLIGLTPGMSLTAYADTDADEGTNTITSDRTDDYIYIYNGTLIINKGVTFTCSDYFYINENGKVELHGTLTGNVSRPEWLSGIINVYLADGAKYTVTGLNPPDTSDTSLCYIGYDAATDGNGTVSVKNGSTDVTSTSEGYKTTTYTFTATPNSGYKFVNWTKGAGGEVLGTDASINVTCEQNGQYQVYANFESDKTAQTITAEDVTATYGDTDKSVSGTTTGDAVTTLPKTGDGAKPVLWLGMIAAGLAVAFAAGFVKKRRER